MNFNRILFIFLFSILSLPSFSQKYKYRADSTKLNLEYSKVQSTMAQITLKRDEARLKLSSTEDKSELSSINAQNSATNNLNNANAAKYGGFSEAKKEKKSANLAYKDSRIEKTDQEDVRNLKKKIQGLDADIRKKQARILELDEMRNNLQN